MYLKNPFKHLHLSAEEQEIERAIEQGKGVEVDYVVKEKKRYQRYAKQTLEKTKNINIRLSERVIQRLKALAAVDGIPYQTLAGSIIHKYTGGALHT